MIFFSFQVTLETGAAAGDLFFFWAGFLSDDLISKKQRPFQFQTWGGNIVHVRFI